MFLIWWTWAIAAVVFLALEILAPGFVFLGFGIGAAVVALGLLAGVVGSSVPLLLLIFAVVSLLAWVVMRRLFAIKGSERKVWTRDINDDP